MRADANRRRAIRVLALLIGALSLAVVILSAYLRLDAAGLGCANWPNCYGSVLTSAPPPLHYGLPRLLHRLVASVALVLTLILVWRCLRPTPLPSAARYAVLLLLLMLALSVLGFFSADPRRALVGFLNIMGGLGLVSFSWRVAMAAEPSSFNVTVRYPPPGILLRVGVVALTLTVLLGAWIGATYSAIACPSLPVCDGVWWPATDGWAALNPLMRPSVAPMPGDAGGVTLHLLHRFLAVTVLLVLGFAALSALRHTATRASGIGVLLLLLTVSGFGVAAVSNDLPLWLVLGHGAAAAMLLGAVASLLRSR
jgi:cytochrome c oxidase assembly protein subunit 15